MIKPDIILIENFIDNANSLFDELCQTVSWNDNFSARKTASFGVAYQYSGVSYDELPFPVSIQRLAEKIAHQLGFLPNNCLINYYETAQSRMGFHVDDVSQMAKNTGVAIISLGATRTMTYRLLADKTVKVNYPLPAGSLLYMDDNVQQLWQHAILKAKHSTNEMPRISLTFRQLISQSTT